MPDQNDFLPGLWELGTGGFGQSEEEKAVKESIDAINKRKPLDRSQLAIAQICVSLARSIHLGNLKGRAVANEAAQLAELLQTLTATDDVPDAGDLPPELQELLHAFQSAPRPDTPSASYPAELR